MKYTTNQSEKRTTVKTHCPIRDTNNSTLQWRATIVAFCDLDNMDAEVPRFALLEGKNR